MGRLLGNGGLQEGFTTSIRPGAEGVRQSLVHPEGATFADRHVVFSPVGSGEPPGAPGGSREVSGGASGSPEGSFWVQFRSSAETLKPLWG